MKIKEPKDLIWTQMQSIRESIESALKSEKELLLRYERVLRDRIELEILLDKYQEFEDL